MQQISDVEEKLAGTNNAISALFSRARICKRLWITASLCIAWRAGTTNRVVVPAPRLHGNRFMGSLKDLQIRALNWNFKTIYGGKEPSRNKVIVLARQAT